MKNIRTAILLTVLFFLSGCQSTQYKDSKKASASVQWGPVEINSTVEKMTASLYAYLKGTDSAAFLAVDKVANRTSEHIDTRMLMNDITTNLVKRQIVFIDRSKRDSTMEEIEIAQTGLIDSETAISVGNLKSPNYLLSGEVTENLQYNKGKKIQYLVVTIQLTELSTGIVKWQEQQRFLKESSESEISW